MHAKGVGQAGISRSEWKQGKIGCGQAVDPVLFREKTALDPYWELAYSPRLTVDERRVRSSKK
jgi:hypothetical protein